MAEGDDKPTGDEVDEVELEDARGGTAAGRLYLDQDSAEARLRRREELRDPAEARRPLERED